MTSRGIGDVRRVLGDRQPQGWIDKNFSRPGPPLPRCVGDELYEYVVKYLTHWEDEVAREAHQYQDGANGAAFLRWALDIRRQCAAVRLILVQYAEAREQSANQLPTLRRSLEALATSWRNKHDWREDWRS